MCSLLVGVTGHLFHVHLWLDFMWYVAVLSFCVLNILVELMYKCCQLIFFNIQWCVCIWKEWCVCIWRVVDVYWRWLLVWRWFGFVSLMFCSSIGQMELVTNIWKCLVGAMHDHDKEEERARMSGCGFSRPDFLVWIFSVRVWIFSTHSPWLSMENMGEKMGFSLERMK